MPAYISSLQLATLWNHSIWLLWKPLSKKVKNIIVFNMPTDILVNIIPIIAKSDTISKEELAKFKLKIMSELLGAGIQTYQFPTGE